MQESISSQGATNFLLTVLLQRLEVSHPGLIQEMTDGVKADHAAISQSGQSSVEIETAIKISLAILDRAAFSGTDEATTNPSGIGS